MTLPARASSRRFPVLILVGAILLLLGLFASIGLLRVARPATAQEVACSPRPCAAPHGFQVYLNDIQVRAGVLMMAVRFENHTSEGFGAASNRQTSPADFQLRAADGKQTAPEFSSFCPRWPELRLDRGASAGPLPLCFPAPAGDYHSAQVIWSPDLGLLFEDVQIPLR